MASPAHAKETCILIVSLGAIASEQRTQLAQALNAALRLQAPRSRQTPHLVFHNLVAPNQILATMSRRSSTQGLPDQKRPASLMRKDAHTGLSQLVTSLTGLHIVVNLGVAAHISTLDAYGVPWAKIPFKPHDALVLPDGLLLAGFPSHTGICIDTIASSLAQLTAMSATQASL